MEITYFYNGKEVRTHMSLHIRRDLRNYFDMDYLDCEGYVLEWCRDKSVETIEMQISPVMVNEYNVSYMTHVTDSVIPFMTRQYNLGTTVYYNLCQVFDSLNLTIGLSD